jgi:hypothetical protein
MMAYSMRNLNRAVYLLTLLALPLSAQEAKKFESEISAHQGIKPYTHPGVVSYLAGRWIGNDNLYNLSNEIRIVVEMIKPSGTTLPITGEQIRAKAETMFRANGLNPYVAEGSTPTVTPFLHLQVLVYPIEGGFTASIELRLIENITIARMQTEGGANWQGITWEKQNLVIAKTNDFATQLQVAVDELMDAFIKRFLFYEKLKTQLKKD